MRMPVLSGNEITACQMTHCSFRSHSLMGLRADQKVNNCIGVSMESLSVYFLFHCIGAELISIQDVPRSR